MQKKFFSLITSLTLIFSCFTPFQAFAAAEQTLAVFEYTASAGTVAKDDLANGDKTNGYDATEGIMQASAKLFASVNGTDPRKLEWSDGEYAYGESTTAMAPVMTAGKKIYGANIHILKWNVQRKAIPVVGNHDQKSTTYAKLFKEYFGTVPGSEAPSPIPSGTTASFDYGNAHFVILNTESDLETQKQWLDEELSKTDKK